MGDKLNIYEILSSLVPGTLIVGLTVAEGRLVRVDHIKNAID